MQLKYHQNVTKYIWNILLDFNVTLLFRNPLTVINYLVRGLFCTKVIKAINLPSALKIYIFF